MENPLDPNALANLLDSIGGDAEFLRELVETFFQDAPAQFAAMRASLADGSPENFRRAAHSLKSNAASFGARTLASQSKQLEDLGKTGDLGTTAGLLSEAEAEYARVRSALEEVIK
ncbi:MAG TPA: Hpt domain-containing protein [Anaerolineales bacterium]|nr:Hpt domain-containing protein [Anaerolineales bacterium]